MAGGGDEEDASLMLLFLRAGMELGGTSLEVRIKRSTTYRQGYETRPNVFVTNVYFEEEGEEEEGGEVIQFERIGRRDQLVSASRPTCPVTLSLTSEPSHVPSLSVPSTPRRISFAMGNSLSSLSLDLPLFVYDVFLVLI